MVMKKTLLLFVFSLFFAGNISAQVLMTEHFTYTVDSSLVSAGYTAHSGAGTNSPRVVTGNLIYPNYAPTGIGGMVRLVNTGEDVHRNLSDSTTSGSLYAFMLVRVDTARTGDYFFHLGPGPIGTTFRARIFVRLATNNNIAFGISKGSATVRYTDSIYTAGTTYFLVMKYTIVTGASNDSVSLFVNPAFSSTEPAPLVSQSDAAISDINPFTFAFRQGSTASSPHITVDAIRISRQWLDVIPVELTSFSATAVNGDVNLQWTTATEKNNSGFEIQRSLNNNGWNAIGFVEGRGTTTQISNYSFVDKNIQASEVQYRLKQIDHDGSFSFSKIVQVNLGKELTYQLNQNYPNPFNPSTVINFQLATNSHVTLKVYDVIGNEVASLIDGEKIAGSYSVSFNASNLASGVYYYKLVSNNFVETKKMMLVR